MWRGPSRSEVCDVASTVTYRRGVEDPKEGGRNVMRRAAVETKQGLGIKQFLSRLELGGEKREE